MSFITLSPLDLALAALLVVALAIVSGVMHLGIGKQMLIAGTRTVVQLLLVGLVLKVLFENASLGWVALMAGIMLLLAGREVMARQKQTFSGWWGYGLGTGAMFLSSFTVTVLALLAFIGNQPWWEPQYAIPLLGMILGNTMNGIALGVDRLTQSARQQRQVIEARLLMGQDAYTAVSAMARDSMRVGMIPIINAMAAAGIVSLPGMMTGQILAGVPPWEAVKYQILIMFMIAGGTGFATMLAVRLGAKRLFDYRHRLRLDRLSER